MLIASFCMQVPFFSDDEETPSTPKADALFIPRENPRSLVIRPTEQWPMRASAEKASPLRDISTPVHENGNLLLFVPSFLVHLSCVGCKSE
jgi:nuclear pore complex protein Nup98-Nup96